MLKDGTYSAVFKTPLGQGTGIAHVADEQIGGCDSIMTYSRYQNSTLLSSRNCRSAPADQISFLPDEIGWRERRTLPWHGGVSISWVLNEVIRGTLAILVVGSFARKTRIEGNPDIDHVSTSMPSAAI